MAAFNGVQLLILNVLAFWSAVNAGGLHPATEGFSHTIAHPDGSTHHSTFIRHNTDVVPRDHDSGVYDPQTGHVVSVHSAGAHGYGVGASHVVASRPLGAYGATTYGGAAYGTSAYGALGAYGAYAAPSYSVAAAPAVSVAAAPAVSVAAAPAVTVAHAPAVSVTAPATTTVRGPFINNRVVQTAFGDVHTPHHEFHHHEHHTVHPTGGTAFAAFKK
ncbi:hypothetical protein MRX96_002781 [Rhipicephalus microplus]